LILVQQNNTFFAELLPFAFAIAVYNRPAASGMAKLRYVAAHFSPAFLVAGGALSPTARSRFPQNSKWVSPSSFCAFAPSMQVRSI
jgi:hypothetical protein